MGPPPDHTALIALYALAALANLANIAYGIDYYNQHDRTTLRTILTTTIRESETTEDAWSDWTTWTPPGSSESEHPEMDMSSPHPIPSAPSPPPPLPQPTPPHPPLPQSTPSQFPQTTSPHWTSPTYEWGPREAAVLPPKAQQHESSGMPLGAITGIVIGVVFVLAIAGVGLYMLVRRWRLTNPPQTLSDKSSNPDSFGYIDDSDAEEMLSLDNDSFLNSLEAVTFQNYWTDSVRHTKL